jgi:multidrug efflux pump
MDYSIVYDPTIFVRGSIEAVVHTLFEALILVVLVVILFLQTWRASIIPLVAVPVSLIGTFAVMHLFGFSLNALSLFGLVLAIGIVVDDAIVVVENVERNIELGLNPFEATKSHERSDRADHRHGAGAVCGVRAGGLHLRVDRAVLQAVRPDHRDLHGDLGVQLADPVAGPGRRAAQGHDAPKDRFSKLLDKVFGGWLFRPFNRFFERPAMATSAPCAVIRSSGIALLLYAGLMVLTFFGFSSTPTGFVPAQDKQYLVAFAQLPDAASLDRTEEVIKRMSRSPSSNRAWKRWPSPACRSTVSPTARTAASCSR